MKVVVVLLIASVVVAAGFLIAFLWAVKSGQYDDTVTPSLRMLHDDSSPVDNPKDKKSSSVE
ncbi:MAG: cbb3-type cytochrome oxidase assembly protein CcoS [Candidatus Zixiibacteriota bacterium]